MKNNIKLSETDKTILLSGKINVPKDNEFLISVESDSQADQLRKLVELGALVQREKNSFSKKLQGQIDDIVNRKPSRLGKSVDPFELEYENPKFNDIENILFEGFKIEKGQNELNHDMSILSSRLRKRVGFGIKRHYEKNKSAK